MKSQQNLTRAGLLLLFAGLLLITACEKTETPSKNHKNSPPTAHAGKDFSIKRGSKVTLDGSNSTDADGDKLNFHWSQTAGTAVELELANSATPSFIAPEDGMPLEFSLVVSDGKTNSPPDSVSIYFLRSTPPKISTGAQITAQHNQRVSLEAKLLGEYTDSPQIQWRQTFGKRVMLENANNLSASFIAPEQSGILIFEVSATNEEGVSQHDSIAVNIDNQPPIAVATTNRAQVNPGDTVTINGSGSSDPDGDPLIYRWKQILGSPVELNGADHPSISFTAPEQNDHLVFTLSVSDGEFSSYFSRVHIKVKPILPETTSGNSSSPVLHELKNTPVSWVQPEHSDVRGHASHHWSYEGTSGPDHWASMEEEYALCGKGKAQSPVNITTSTTKKGAGPIEFHYQTSNLNMVNNGHTIQVNYNPGSYIVHGGKRYDLLQFHFHAPSEHAINGKHSDLVAHLVHKAQDGQLAVVAVLFDEGDSSETLAPIWEHMPNHQGSVEKEISIDLNQLLPKHRSYYHYTGSLTTPPCSENVNWNVLTTTVPASAEQVSQFKQIFPLSVRPIQALNTRPITVN